MRTNPTVTVSRSVLSNNLDVLKGRLNPGVKIMAVVKANAYGHGSVEVARELADKADWFAVNSIDEGIELREADIMNPILVFGVPSGSEAGAYGSFNLTATVSAVRHFDWLTPGTSYHLNFDTGMGRLGFLPGQVQEVKKQRAIHEELTCTGIYSHFATADVPGSEKVNRQLNTFKAIREEFEPGLLTHMCNTGGIAFYPDAHFDMVRTGIGLYGYPPGEVPVPGLKPALCWETSLVQVKPVIKGETVSYGARWQAPEDGFIGVIPVGYSDGFRRNLTGQSEVMIEGKKYPVVGTVTMNYCMVFLGPRPVPEGADVSVFDGKNITASTWAAKLGTIPYEILTGIAPHLPRAYVS